MKQEVYIRKIGCIFLPANSGRDRKANSHDPRVLAFQAEVMRLGFIFNEDVIKELSRQSDSKLATVYSEVLTTLKKLVGANVRWRPFYPNFPSQVMEASDIELFLNAIAHYWTFGRWTPQYEEHARIPEFENTNFKVLGLAKGDAYVEIFKEILGSNASITDIDRTILLETMKDSADLILIDALPKPIPFKENLCWFVAECIKSNRETLGVSALKTATDVLRVATHLSGGDISLAENSKFKNFSRPMRRLLVNRLEKVINIDDVFRHRGKWVRLAHNLHVGEYAKVAPETFRILSEARNANSRYQTFNSEVETAFVTGNRSKAIGRLAFRPGMFARRLDHAVRTFGDRGVINPFLDVADQVDTRVLLQMRGHFSNRNRTVTKRLVFPKNGKAYILRDILKYLPLTSINKIQTGIDRVLKSRFAKLPKIGNNVYIDPAMAECPVPLSLRTASEGLNTVARGTRIPLAPGKDTIRMFIYWKGEDIDLSGFFVNEDFTKEERIAYYNLREGFGCHSGDVTHAPKGACEFIDIDMNKAVAAGFRYLAMSVLVFRGPNFGDHEICYAGWMTRSRPNSNEVFDPKTVEQRITVKAKSKDAIPVIFDMVERKAIWLDISTTRGQNINNRRVANNVENNKASLYDAITAAISFENKPNLYDLFRMHAKARANNIVLSPDNADFKFGWDGDVKPTDTTKILSEYL